MTYFPAMDLSIGDWTFAVGAFSSVYGLRMFTIVRLRQILIERIHLELLSL
jgi:hypothetical protein